MYEEFLNTGATSDTPKNIMLGAGTIHKGLMHGYYKLCADTVTTKLTVVADNETPDAGEIKLSVAQAKSNDVLEVGDYVQLFEGWNLADTIIGATSGGNKLAIVPEITQLDVDGVLVRTKGLDMKDGEKATLEITFIELKPELIAASVLGTKATSAITGYDVTTSKANIVDGDYYRNIAFVGKKTDGSPIIAILPNALCTSGFEAEGKKKTRLCLNWY